MEQINVSKKVTATILSMSLLTVMAGATIAPALGIIKAHFSEANGLLVTTLSTEAVTMIMVGLDVVAFFVGLVFGSLMHTFRQPVKYFAPLFFLLGYAAYLVPSVGD